MEFIKKSINIAILIACVLLTTSIMLICSSEQKYTNGYIINKYIDTCLVSGKHISYNTYGIQYKIIYQEDKTMYQTIKTVDKNLYYSSEINTIKLIKYIK